MNNKGAMIMKTIINSIAGTLLVVGLVMMAGSAGDCDGKCMEQANTIGEMLMYAGIGMTMFVFGVLVLMRNAVE
jgi:uncharacterized membrane protein